MIHPESMEPKLYEVLRWTMPPAQAGPLLPRFLGAAPNAIAHQLNAQEFLARCRMGTSLPRRSGRVSDPATLPTARSLLPLRAVHRPPRSPERLLGFLSSPWERRCPHRPNLATAQDRHVVVGPQRQRSRCGRLSDPATPPAGRPPITPLRMELFLLSSPQGSPSQPAGNGRVRCDTRGTPSPSRPSPSGGRRQNTFTSTHAERSW
jgi:hypothetical protein